MGSVIGVPARIEVPNLLWQLGLGLLLSGVIGMLAYRRAALSASGAAGAALTGTLIFGFGGWAWGALLITFFVLSTLLSKYKQRTKEGLAEKFEKGAQRDLGQVLANGGAGTLMALAYAVDGSSAWFFAFCGAMAAVNADTWATELGVLSRRPPRLITNGRVVERGTSGGVSRAGVLATLAGGAIIGLAAVVYAGLSRRFGPAPALPDIRPTALLGAAALSGLTGSLFDSFLGATIQAIYYAPHRDKETEKPVEPDGTLNRHIRGWLWMNNDWVNFLSSLVGAAAAAAVHLVLM